MDARGNFRPRQGAMIERLSSDSRRCAPGVAFLAYPGEAADGRAHIATRSRAAPRPCCGSEQGFAWGRELARAERCRCATCKQQAGALAHEFYGRPSRVALGVRRHRHQRQDLVQPMDRRARSGNDRR